jgi:hypothetical protein
MRRGCFEAEGLPAENPIYEAGVVSVSIATRDSSEFAAEVTLYTDCDDKTGIAW